MAVSVTFDGNAGTALTVVSDTEITVTTPAGDPGLVDVVVTTSGGSDTLADGFEYTETIPVPTVTAIDPAEGPEEGGTTVTITGTGFLEGGS
jgi:hypothetical protein